MSSTFIKNNFYKYDLWHLKIHFVEQCGNKQKASIPCETNLFFFMPGVHPLTISCHIATAMSPSTKTNQKLMFQLNV